MLKGVFELEAPATDKLLGGDKGELVIRLYQIAGFAGNAFVDPD
jgi:hypothetical protein